MKKMLAFIAILTIVFNLNVPTTMSASEEEEYEVIENKNDMVDEFHYDHSIKANFIPYKILNKDDSLYQAPEQVEDLVGLYTAETEIPSMDVKLKLMLSIEEDGLFNLAYYFENKDDQKGTRFYADESGKLNQIDAFYQDLVIMTAGLTEMEGGLSSGLIRKTLSPVVTLDEAGEPDALYPYHEMAYELRESINNARVYQFVGLYVVDNEIKADINHLIGYNGEDSIMVTFEPVEDEHADELLVEKRTYEVLQDSFDNYLEDHNDFVMDFQSVNEFLQAIQAMHLKTNLSFPKETRFELIDPQSVKKAAKGDNAYALIINDEILYFYDSQDLFVTDSFKIKNEMYSSDVWNTN